MSEWVMKWSALFIEKRCQIILSLLPRSETWSLSLSLSLILSLTHSYLILRISELVFHKFECSLSDLSFSSILGKVRRWLFGSSEEVEEESFRQNRSNQKMEDMIVIEGEFAIVPEKEKEPEDPDVLNTFWKNCSKHGTPLSLSFSFSLFLFLSLSFLSPHTQESDDFRE